MNENLITWNVTNWITIVLMVAVGVIILTLAAQAFKVTKPSVPTNIS